MTKARDPTDLQFGGDFKSGYYLTMTAKPSNLFDLFGTSNKNLVVSVEDEKSPGKDKPKVGDEK